MKKFALCTMNSDFPLTKLEINNEEPKENV